MLGSAKLKKVTQKMYGKAFYDIKDQSTPNLHCPFPSTKEGGSFGLD
jgi:hypothetical protein